MRRIHILLFVFFLFVSSSAVAKVVDYPEEWREDLRVLAEQMQHIHPDTFQRIDEDLFDAEIKRIHDVIPSLTRNQVVTEFQKLVALLRDGHSAIWMVSAGEAFATEFPMVIYPFSDGVYLTSVAPEYREYVGKRVVRLGNFAIDEAIKTLEPVISGENEFTILSALPRFFRNPAVLDALDIANDDETIELTVADENGEESSFTITAVPHDKFTTMGMEATSDGTIHARKTAAPLYLKDFRHNYWFKHLPEHNMVYVKFNRVRDEPHQSFADFCETMFAFIDDNKIENMVLDLRFNGGGNNQLLKPLIHGLIKRDQTVNREGHFYTIFGRGTYSAAVSCTAWLEDHTNVRFVGEPVGSAPNHWGDSDQINLPNSNITVSISAWRWQTQLPWDQREFFAPEVPAPPTFADYVTGKDLAMERILLDRSEPSLRDLLGPLAEAGDIMGLKSAYREYKKTHIDHWTTTEALINRAGYMYLDNATDVAIAFFELNVETYPNSANCYDSLADGHLKSGNRDKAIEYYKLALKADPEFANSIRMLLELGAESVN